MLEGKEVEGKIGDGGDYSIDVDAKGFITAEAGYEKKIIDGVEVSTKNHVRIDIVVALEMLAKKTDSQVDDKLVAIIKGALGR